jgi:hypothetical protein
MTFPRSHLVQVGLSAIAAKASVAKTDHERQASLHSKGENS